MEEQLPKMTLAFPLLVLFAVVFIPQCVANHASHSESQGEVGEGSIIGIIGEAAILPCELTFMTPVSIKDINFEWRAEGDIVDAFVKGHHELTHQEKQYRNRTELFITELSPRNLSLKVSHISPDDRKVYECWFFIDEDRNGYLDKWLLKVAGHYSEPLIKGPAKIDLRNRDADFTCAATGGYPEPKVHWFINQKMVLPQSNRIKTTIKNISSEEYAVKSVLTINMTDDTSVYCTVENELLKEERKSPDIQYLIKTKNEQQRGDRRHWWIAVIVAVALLVIIVVIAMAVFRSRNNSASSGSSCDRTQQQGRREQEQNPLQPINAED